jgi:hypothetical protein
VARDGGEQRTIRSRDCLERAKWTDRNTPRFHSFLNVGPIDGFAVRHLARYFERKLVCIHSSATRINALDGADERGRRLSLAVNRES